MTRDGVQEPLLGHEEDRPDIKSSGGESRGRCHWLQTTSALLALQLGWGLWLFVAIFARLGWYPALGTLATLAVLTTYSGTLFARLYACTPGAVLFGDIGQAAAGSVGRGLVYAIFYTLNATRGVILHLAATQSLLHIFPSDQAPPLWQCGLVILVVASVLVQLRSLARLSWVFMLGTSCQLVVIVSVLWQLISKPDPDAVTKANAITAENYPSAIVAVMNVVFAFGGQFAFIEIMSAMKQPSQFPWAVSLCTCLMSTLYGCLGAIGYWSRGDSIHGIIIFSLGDDLTARLSSACILVQAISQYMVNLNVWTHNLLVLLSRHASRRITASSSPKKGAIAVHANHDSVHVSVGAAENGENADEELAPPTCKCSSDHDWRKWLVVSLFVVSYSYLISMSVPYFSTLVGIITGATYLLAAYALPAWFVLSLMPGRLHLAEKGLLYTLIPTALLVSAAGMYASILQLLNDIDSGGEGGWGTPPGAPHLGTAVMRLLGFSGGLA